MSGSNHENRTRAFLALAFARSRALWGLVAVLPTASGALRIAGTFGPAIACSMAPCPHLPTDKGSKICGHDTPGVFCGPVKHDRLAEAMPAVHLPSRQYRSRGTGTA